MKTTLLKLLVTCVCMGTTLHCKLPQPADFDIAVGRIVYKGVCQKQLLYLVNRDVHHAGKSGYTYKDSLTVYGQTYRNVIQIDTSQTSLFVKNKVGDKISLDFNRGPRNLLPICTDLRRGAIQTIYVLNTGAAIY